VVEHEQEGRLTAGPGDGQDVLQAGPRARLDDERDALVPVEPAEGGQRTALDLDHGDAQGRGVQHEALEGLTAIRHHEQPPGGTASGECLFDGPATGDDLLVLGESLDG
jgi:hypothetical protein